MKTTIKTAAKDLLLFRETHGKTREEVSKSSGVSIGTLISLEKGGSTPHAKTVSKLNKYYKTIPDPEIEKVG